LRYDTVTRFGWAVDIRTHGIRQIVERLLAEDWEPPLDGGVGKEVPDFENEDDCVVRAGHYTPWINEAHMLDRIASTGSTGSFKISALKGPVDPSARCQHMSGRIGVCDRL
jgi:hypothetical protein